MRPRLPLLLLAMVLALPATPAFAAGYQQVVDLTFPVAGKTSYSDSYAAPRSGGRVHKATDIMAPEGAKVYAAVGGTIEWITGLTEKVPSYGYMIRIAGDDGRDYAYIHMGRNNGPASKAYVKGLRRGSRVARGQHIAFVGCSGNASCTAPHLHFEIHDDRVTDPFKAQQINPYFSLRAAQAEGDVGKGSGAGDAIYPYRDVARSVHLKAILELAKAGIMDGCDEEDSRAPQALPGPLGAERSSGTKFCPNTSVDRSEMAQVMAKALKVAPTDEDYFSDDDGRDAEDAINALAAAGVVNGCGDGSIYCPDQAVTRARMASYLARGFELPESPQDFFVDDDGHTHEDNINRLAASGITAGCASDRFCLTGKVTRGQLASFVSRGLDL